MLAITACGGNDETLTLPTEQEIYNSREVENNEAVNHDNQVIRGENQPINMHIGVDGEFLYSLTGNIYEFSHIEFETHFPPDTLIFTSDETIYDFAFITLGTLDGDRTWEVIPVIDILFSIPEITPDSAFVLNLILGIYQIPQVGISFTDGYGIRHYMAILIDNMSSMGDDRPPFALFRFEPVTEANLPPAATQEPIEQTVTWQESYAELLRAYAAERYYGQRLEEWETGWEFALHDINRDGIPELLLGARQISGHIEYRYVYTF